MKSLFLLFLVASCLAGLSCGSNATTFARETIQALETLATDYPVLTTLPNRWYSNYSQGGDWGVHCSWAGITCGVNSTVNTLSFDARLDGFQLEGNFSQAFFDLPHLFSLTLRGQNFDGTVPSKILLNSFILSDLIISNCNLHGPFPPFTNISQSGTALRRIDFSHNHFTGSIPTQFFNISQFTRMSSIDFSYNEFTGNLGLTGCGAQLQNLFVNNNQLSGTVACLGIKAAADLSNNQFSGPLPIFASNETRLDNNRFSDLGSVFSTVRPTSFDLILTFSNNPINQALPTSIATGQRFLLLDMSSCGLSGSFSTTWESAIIQDLVASNNSITALWTPTSTQLASFTYLDVSNNPITTLSGFGAEATALKTLLCHKCQITGAFPTSISAIPGLQNLDLSGNLLTGALPALASVDFLVALDISDNELTGKPLTLLQSMGSTHPLHYVDLARNGFELCDPATYGAPLNIQFGSYCSAVCQTTSETIDSACLSAWTYCTLADCTPDGTLPPDGGSSFPVATPPGYIPPISPPVTQSPSISSPEGSSPSTVPESSSSPSFTPTNSQQGPMPTPSNEVSVIRASALQMFLVFVLLLFVLL